MLGGSPGWDGGAVMAGDHDHDGRVTGDDFLVWQRQLGARTPALLNSDGNGNRIVDAADLAVWSGHFGDPMLAAAATAADEDSAAAKVAGWIYVAEPATVKPPAVAARRPRGEYRPPVATSDAHAIDAAIAALAEPTEKSTLASAVLNPEDTSWDGFGPAMEQLFAESAL